MDIHEMEGYREGNVIIWNCPVCGRRVLVTEDGLVIAEPGDPIANHRGGMGGLTIGAVVVSAIEDDGPFEQWAEENAERLFTNPS